MVEQSRYRDLLAGRCYSYCFFGAGSGKQAGRRRLAMSMYGFAGQVKRQKRSCSGDQLRLGAHSPGSGLVGRMDVTTRVRM